MKLYIVGVVLLLTGTTFAQSQKRPVQKYICYEAVYTNDTTYTYDTTFEVRKIPEDSAFEKTNFLVEVYMGRHLLTTYNQQKVTFYLTEKITSYKYGPASVVYSFFGARDSFGEKADIWLLTNPDKGDGKIGTLVLYWKTKKAKAFYHLKKQD